MFKIVFVGTDSEPSAGFRAPYEVCLELAEAWNVNFDSEVEVIEDTTKIKEEYR